MTKVVSLGNAKKITGITLIGQARKEKNLQKTLELWQVQTAKGEISLSKAVESAKKELERVSKNREEAKKLKITLHSDYKTLKAMYETNLQGLTLESLSSDYASKASDQIAKFTECNNEQKAAICAYFELKAKKEFQVVSHVRSFLELVGEIKAEVKAAKEVVEKVEA